MAATTILLVDDDEIIRSALRDLLSHKGFIVTVAVAFPYGIDDVSRWAR
jgi:CheY-like chemotaxis protein